MVCHGLKSWHAHSLYYAELTLAYTQSLASATQLQGAPFWEMLTQSFERGSHDFKIYIHIYIYLYIYISIYKYEYLNSIMQSSWTDLDRLLSNRTKRAKNSCIAYARWRPPPFHLYLLTVQWVGLKEYPQKTIFLSHQWIRGENLVEYPHNLSNQWVICLLS